TATTAISTLSLHDALPISLPQDHADPWHGGAGIREDELSPVADHPAPLEVLAGIEAGGVDERDDRQVEGVAERDEAGALLRRLRSEEHTSELQSRRDLVCR